MKKRMSMLVAICLMLAGCAGLGGRRSSVTLPDGKRIEMICQSDGVLEYTQGDIKVRVDNRGPLGQVWAAATASLNKIYDKLKDAPVEAPK